MNITYDVETDAAYIKFVEDVDVARTVPGDGEADGVNLDFDDEGRLVGIEILEAKKRLPQDLLDVADSA